MCLCLYVNDADGVYAQALAAGGASMRPVKDQFYGDRSGTITISDSQLIEIPVKPGEIVIEAVDFESAGEPFDTGEAFAVDEKTSRRPRPN